MISEVARIYSVPLSEVTTRVGASHDEKTECLIEGLYVDYNPTISDGCVRFEVESDGSDMSPDKILDALVDDLQSELESERED